MPIYDYACTRCGRVVEVVHGVHSPGPGSCEACGGPMKKLLSTPAVHFKGSGWAKKDRGSKTTTKAAARASAGGDGGGERSASGDRPGDVDGSSAGGGAADHGPTTSSAPAAAASGSAGETA